MGPLDYKNNKLSNCVIRRGPSIVQVPHSLPPALTGGRGGVCLIVNLQHFRPRLLPEDSDNVSEKSLGLLVRGHSDVGSKGGRKSSVLPLPRPQGALDQHLGVSRNSGSQGIRTGGLLLFSTMSP